LLALIAVAPLIAHGCSCGHDFEFHLQSWLDASAQLRHGTFDPAWTISAAWNAGEPRFIFYPPLSWMLGAVLTLLLPFPAVPIAFTAIVLFGAAVSMYILARDYASSPIAILAAAIYIAGPYMLFTAFERTAYGELLAAIWLPWLLLSALRTQPRIVGLALSLALLWLSNAPAAVIGVYVVLVIAVLRIAHALLIKNTACAAQLLARFAAGGALGLALPAFYLLPAAYERRYIQVAMVIIPNLRVDDNFLFGHTGDRPHDAVLHTASLIAIIMLVATTLALLCAWFTQRTPNRSTIPARPRLPLILAALTACIVFLLTPLSLPLWHHLPELAFLQFPWRMLSILGVILALAIAFALRHISSTKSIAVAATVAAFLFVAGMSARDISTFRQPCEVLDSPSARAQLFRTHHGVEPTDEYTPTDADNDVLRWDDPAYWLDPNPTGFAPNTVPNPAATIINYDTPPPVTQTVSGTAPHHLVLTLPHADVLVFNLRDYPNWQLFRNGTLITERLQRDDGLLAVELPPGRSVIDLRWHRSWDELTGDLITLAALLILAIALLRARTIKPDA
jgi:hypothetical protein